MMNFADFFFLRPVWLLLTFPFAALLVYLYKGRMGLGGGQWHKLIDPQLLKHLTITSGASSSSRWMTIALGTAVFSAIIALAGPAWQKNEQPAFTTQQPVVMVLSLAQSMNGTDIRPNRLARAGHKVHDILDTEKGVDLALIIYSDQPFVASPLTQDAQVISDMLPELSTSLMPVLGNRLDLALLRATELLQQAGANKGEILVLADSAGEQPQAARAAAMQAVKAGFSVNVMGIGTPEGAALQTASGRIIAGQDGLATTVHLQTEALQSVASAGAGRYATMSADDSDLDSLLIHRESALAAASAMDVKQRQAEFHADTWMDMGYWLLFVPVLLAPLAFRKNVLLAFPVVMAIGMTTGIPTADASVWQDLWKTPDQQALDDFSTGDYTSAATRFQDPAWRAGALFRDGQFDGAAAAYASGNTADDVDALYNQGNALAKSGQLQAALDVYDRALTSNPGDDDLVFNRELVAQLLKEQEQEQEQKQDQSQQGEGEQQDQSQQGEGEQQDQSQQGKGEQQDQSQQGKGEQQDQSQQGKGEQQDQSQQGEGEQQDQSQQGEGDQQRQPQQGEGEQQDQSQQGEAEQQGQSQQGEGEQQGQSQQGKGGQQDQSQQGEGEQQAAAGPSNEQLGESRNVFQRAMHELLSGNGQAEPDSQSGSLQETDSTAQGTAPAQYSEQEQSVEQQLRKVPDDPSGLLRARIRQHYAQQRAGRSGT